MVETEGVEPSTTGCRPVVFPLALRPHWGGRRGSNPRDQDPQSCAYPSRPRPHLEHLGRFELPFPVYRTGASPTMLQVQTGAGDGIPTRCLSHTKRASLPRVFTSKMEPEGRIKLPSPRYEGGALSSELLRHGAKNGTRTRVICLADRRTSRCTIFALVPSLRFERR